MAGGRKMLKNFSEMLKKAREEKYAVGSFNVYNYETMKGVVKAAESCGLDAVIVAFGAKYLKNMGLEEAVSMARELAAQSTVDICLHLDHCPNMDTVFAAIRAGFNSVMYDGSALPYAENEANTKKVCEVAHACGVSVEAELGSLAAGIDSHEGSETDVEQYTDPDAAAQFVQNTGVDALAVSVGTVHGLYKGEPNIRLDILSAINDKAGIPLVLHGGSGIPEQTITACIGLGIAKINVNTEISSYVVKKTQEKLTDGSKLPHLSVLALMQQDWVAEVVTKYIRFFRG